MELNAQKVETVKMTHVEQNIQKVHVEKFLIFSTIFLIIFGISFNFLKRWWKLLRSDLKCDFSIPFFGSHWRELLKIETWHETLERLYYKYPTERFIVLQEIGGRPEFLIRDPELVKQIAVRDFSSFTNRVVSIHAGTDPVYGIGLSNLTNGNWRRIRTVLTSLLSGQKLKRIAIPSLDENKRDMVKFLENEMHKSSKNELSIDMMDFTTRSTIDGYCLTTFGLKTDSLRQNSGSDYGFFDLVQSVLNRLNSMSPATHKAIIWFPRTMKYLFGKSMMSDDDNNFFTKSCNDIVDNRIANGINRSDYIQFLQVLSDNSPDNDKKSKSKVDIFSEISIQIVAYYSLIVSFR